MYDINLYLQNNCDGNTTPTSYPLWGKAWDASCAFSSRVSDSIWQIRKLLCRILGKISNDTWIEIEIMNVVFFGGSFYRANFFLLDAGRVPLWFCFLRLKERSFWKKTQWATVKNNRRPKVCVSVIRRSPRRVAAPVESEQHDAEHFHLERFENLIRKIRKFKIQI